MPRFSRRSVLRGTASTCAASAFSLPMLGKARAADFILKYANQSPASAPVNVRAREAADKIREESGGRVDIKIFPNNQLGSDADMISQLRSGAIDFMTETGALMENLVPTASINAVGFAFPDYAAVWKAMDGDLGAAVRKGFAKANLYAFAKVWDNGFRQITSGTKPINSPEDLKGFKIRVPVAPIQVALFKGLGAAAISLPLKEVYSSLQTHLADGQENALVLIDTFKFYEVQKYCSITKHQWDGFWMLSSMKRLSKSTGTPQRSSSELTRKNSTNPCAASSRSMGWYSMILTSSPFARRLKIQVITTNGKRSSVTKYGLLLNSTRAH
jgi:TRAP-type transport system periplasmic protein